MRRLTSQPVGQFRAADLVAGLKDFEERQHPLNRIVHAEFSWCRGITTQVVGNCEYRCVKEVFKMTTVITAEELLEHWQGHRRLTRRVIEAFPDDQLFSFAVGGMRPFFGIGD